MGDKKAYQLLYILLFQSSISASENRVLSI